MTQELYTDCLILGTGIAGLTAALSLSELGHTVVCVSAAKELEDCNSSRAQGGIIFETAETKLLYEDILKAGCFLNNPESVQKVIQCGPRLIQEILIDKLQIPFDKNTNSSLHFTKEGGHSASRIIHHGDKSGKAIQSHLFSECLKQKNIKLLDAHTAINLLMTPSHATEPPIKYGPTTAFGAFVFDQKNETVYPIFASHTVIATGGIGQIYLHSTNSTYSRGDGIALAYRAGCRLEALEYVQFHPTTFYHPKHRRFLISEALRGEGGILLNQKGERFLAHYLPEFETPELAPRDRVAWAIHRELLNSGNPCVYLDLTHLKSSWIQERFPFVYESCLQSGVDITTNPIPVVPGAHYHCGGIWTDLNAQTSVSHLWAAGEVAFTGLHGANRLASTSLLEGLVFGWEAAQNISKALHREGPLSFPKIAPWKSKNETVDPGFLAQDWTTLKQTLWNYVGLMKSEHRLQRADGIILELERGIERFYQNARLSDSLIGLRHACLVSRLIIKSSLRNKKPLGCFFREDSIEI